MNNRNNDYNYSNHPYDTTNTSYSEIGPVNTTTIGTEGDWALRQQNSHVQYWANADTAVQYSEYPIAYATNIYHPPSGNLPSNTYESLQANLSTTNLTTEQQYQKPSSHYDYYNTESTYVHTGSDHSSLASTNPQLVVPSALSHEHTLSDTSHLIQQRSLPYPPPPPPPANTSYNLAAPPQFYTQHGQSRSQSRSHSRSPRPRKHSKSPISSRTSHHSGTLGPKVAATSSASASASALASASATTASASVSVSASASVSASTSALALAAAVPTFHPCPEACGKLFTSAKDAMRHARETKNHRVNAQPRFVCPGCDARMDRRDNLKRHVVNQHPNRQDWVELVKRMK